MRRRLRGKLPALSFHFNLKWADIETMPPPELDAYLDALHNLKG